MEVRCKHCSRDIAPEDVSLEESVAKCHECRTVFDVSDQLREPSGPRKRKRKRRKPVHRDRRRPPIPDGWELREDEGPPVQGGYRQAPRRRAQPGFSVRWRWFEWLKHIPMLLAALVVSSASAAGFATVISGGAHSMMVLLSLIPVAGGMAVLYGALSGILNHTVLSVHDGLLSLRHGPLPWRPRRDIPTDTIKQLYCVELSRDRKRGSRAGYELRAKLADGRDLILLTLPYSGQALYLEQRLEFHLGIIDVEVAGEIPA
jgi:hypothetical protein